MRTRRDGDIMPEVKPKRSPEVKWRSEDENIVLYTPSESRIIVLNQTAGSIWKLIDGKRTTEEIASELVEEYEDVTGEKALKDVEKTIHNLENKGLVIV